MENISDLKRFSAKVNSTAIMPRATSQSSDQDKLDPIATLALLAGRTLDEPIESSPDERPNRKRPLDRPWQAKWLDLERTCDDVQKLADAAERFAFAWFRSEPCRFKVVVGNVGCGKTHVSTRIAMWARLVSYERWSRKRLGDGLPSVAFFTARILSPKSCGSDMFDKHIEEMRDASLVILDDIGTEVDEYKDGTTTARLCHILNRMEGRYLWITTNKQPSAWVATWDKRVEDRMLAADVLMIEAPSYRSEI